MLLAKPQLDDASTGERRAATRHGVSGLGHDDRVATAGSVEQDLGEGVDRLLRAERGNDMPSRVERHAEAAADPRRHRLAQLRQSDGRRVSHPLAHAVAQRLQDRRIGGLARVAHPQVDHLEAARTALRGGLVQAHEGVGRGGAVDGGERHDRKLAEHDPAERLVGPDERRDLDALVDSVCVTRRTGAEVDGRESRGT